MSFPVHIQIEQGLWFGLFEAYFLRNVLFHKKGFILFILVVIDSFYKYSVVDYGKY
jgi:hypothetical protein